MIESPGISAETVVTFIAHVKDSLSHLRFKTEMLNESIKNFKRYLDNLSEDRIGNSYMYTSKLQAHPRFVSAVEKFSNHLADGSSLDVRICCSHACEL